MNQRVITHSVFFGLYPGREAAAALAAAQRRLQHGFGVRTGLMLPDRLHVSLFGLAEQPRSPSPSMVAEIGRAVSRLEMGAFKIAFDTMTSFRGRRGARPAVLIGDEGVTGVSWLADKIRAALLDVGLEGWRSTTPHLTLAWSDIVVPETPVAPVMWTAREFVLIDSFQGAGRHDVLGRWPLRGA